MLDTTTLYRPVGQKELDLISATGYRAFPPRLPNQPIFYLLRYDLHVVGGSQHQEYWIPSEDLAEFNANIVGEIEVIAEYRSS
jgi:hypothetical protein